MNKKVVNGLIIIVFIILLILIFLLCYYSFGIDYKIHNKNNNYVFLNKDPIVEKKKLSSYKTTIDNLDIYYLALNGKKTLEIEYDVDRTINKLIKWDIDDPSIVKIENNVIYGLKNGTTKIKGSLEDGFSKTYTIMVTDIIIPPKVNHKKKALPCHKYSKEEAELLDKILFSRVEEGGKGSRGGVVAAARFITLEFPYLIKYFNENGRLDSKSGRRKVDGEGRFYHEGLYLDNSKFDILERRDNGKIYKDTGPAIWGCPLYDRFVSKTRSNGLTCSGFVTWAMLNGGFDVGDVGAGEHKAIDNELSDLGPHINITLDYMKGNTYKVGDFIARNGHAALIIGFDETPLYVAEELPRNPGTSNLDLNVYTYGRYDNKKKLEGHNKQGIVVDPNLTYVVEMSDIYPNGDGWTTDMWE